MFKKNNYLKILGLFFLCFGLGCFGDNTSGKSAKEKEEKEIEKLLFAHLEKNGMVNNFLEPMDSGINSRLMEDINGFDLFKRRRESFSPTEDYYFDVVNYVYGLYRIQTILQETKPPISPCRYYDVPQLELKRKILLAFDDVGEYLKKNKMSLNIIPIKMKANGKVIFSEKNNLYINNKFDKTNFDLQDLDLECIRTIAHELYHLFDFYKNDDNFYQHPKTETKNCLYFSHRSFLMEYGATGEMTIQGFPILSTCESNDSTILNF